jgi:hypothetical protein
MRRRRQHLYREPEPEPRSAKRPAPPIDPRELQREVCAQWRPHLSAVSITDGKRRTWPIADRTGLDVFSREVPIGSDVSFRVFWTEDHVRAVCFRVGEDRSTSPNALLALLRRSFRIDHPEAPLVSKSERFQQLYDRRGMGRR